MPGRQFSKYLGWIMALSTSSWVQAETPPRAREFIAEHVRRVRPLEIEANMAWWDANTTGKDEAFRRKEEAQNRLDQVLADKARFQELKSLKGQPIEDPLVARQLHLLYLQTLEKQVDPALLKQLTSRANAIEKAFNVYRAKVAGKELTDSQVRTILKESKSSAERKETWEASKGVGQMVSSDLVALARLRNQLARELGFRDFHVLQLELNEQKQDQVLALFNELDSLTREPFLAAKREIDTRLAAGLKIEVDELRPWHYHDPFFQEPPAVYESDLDSVFAKVDILKLCRDFYAGIGLPIDDVIAKSDLYEKPGKSPHAFCTDIDREGDVRVLANIVPNERWMSTMLHELGHAVYSSKNIPSSVPYLMRTDAHILATEGIAMMFERFSKSSAWLVAMGVPLADPAGYDQTAYRMRRNQLLIFSRWCQVMFRFEKEMYANPEQDLNTLWWDLVEKYQGLHRPEGRSAPDFASKIHVVSAPCYYHNYMLGELFACQTHAALVAAILKPEQDPRKAIYVNDRRAGAWLKEKVFAPGKTLPWNELTRFATGAPLSPRAFAREFQAN